MTPDEYCQQKAAQSGSSFYYSFLFLPPPRRRAITALYAFCREVDDVVDEVHDAGVARTKLAWWRSEIARTFAGIAAASGGAGAACRSCASSRCPTEHLQTIIDGMAMDLVQTRYLDFAALELYCHRVAGVVGLLSAEIFGYADAVDARLRARPRHRVPAHEHLPRRRRGRAPRPHLPAAGGTRDASASRRRRSCAPEYVAGVPSPDGVRDRARADVVRTRAARSCPPRTPAQRPGLIMAAIYRTLLDEIARDGYRVLDRRTSLTPLRKLWIAWKTTAAASCDHRRRLRGMRRGGRRSQRAACRASLFEAAPVLGGRARRVERDGLRARQRPAPAARRLRDDARALLAYDRRGARAARGGRWPSCRSSPDRPTR